jgi:hypothetical protein
MARPYRLHDYPVSFCKAYEGDTVDLVKANIYIQVLFALDVADRAS